MKIQIPTPEDILDLEEWKKEFARELNGRTVAEWEDDEEKPLPSG